MLPAGGRVRGAGVMVWWAGCALPAGVGVRAAGREVGCAVPGCDGVVCRVLAARASCRSVAAGRDGGTTEETESPPNSHARGAGG